MTTIGKVVALGPEQGTKFRIAEDRFRTMGRPAQRSEAFSVIEYEGAAGIPGPPPHIHHSFEEAWFILDGKVKFTADGRAIAAERGSYLFVPRGVVHSFQVVGKRPARWLGIFSPGRFVGLIEELGPLIPVRGPPNFAALARLFAKYDSGMVGGRG
jgi:quercetin dioxygenase-like cupin family protein